jgi:glycosyltransferase involved in cell wall biosynthesis
MSRLAKNHKLLLAGPPNYFGDFVHADRRSALPKSGVTWREDQFYTFSPPKFLFATDKLQAWDRFSKKLRAQQIRRALTKLRFGPLALFLWHPMFAGMLGSFDEQVSCYYVYDHFAGFVEAGADKHRLEEDEEKLLRGVDIVFTAGAGLWAAKNKYGNAINVPNGVDYEFFSQALSQDLPVPKDLTAIPEPRLGYIGNINEKVDFEILQFLANEREEWSIVLVGADRVRTPDGRNRFEALRRSPNVHFLGPKPQAEIPGYLRAMNVCLIPYCMSGWSYFGCPLKLHEYLAAGKPVVASPLPSICAFGQVISTPSELGGWITEVERSLAANTAHMISQRLEVARANGWDKRIAEIESAIAKTVTAKGHKYSRS